MTADQYKGLKIRDNGVVGSLIGTILSANLERGELIVSWKHGSYTGLSLEQMRRDPGRYTVIS